MMSQEVITQVISDVLRKEGFIKWRNYDLLITQERIIFARYTREMYKTDNKAMVESLKGKSFKERMATTMSGNQRLYERYQDKPYDSIISATEGNFQIPINQITKVKRPMGVQYDQNHQEIPRKVIIVTNQGKHELKFHSVYASDGTYKAIKSLIK